MAPSFRHADSEDSDQTGRMPRLILVFAGRTLLRSCHDAAQINIRDISILNFSIFVSIN